VRVGIKAGHGAGGDSGGVNVTGCMLPARLYFHATWRRVPATAPTFVGASHHRCDGAGSPKGAVHPARIAHRKPCQPREVTLELRIYRGFPVPCL
jgi:hypothetical protein